MDQPLGGHLWSTPRHGGLDLHLEVIYEACGVFLDLAHHAAKESEPLALVFDQGVALRHRPESDAIFEVIHFIEVVPPPTVDHAEHHPTLKFADSRIAQFFFTLAIRNRRVRQHLSSEILTAEI